MRIVIRRLQLTNFKCFRSLELDFDLGITTIRGRNGVGKTTIADAILWCLFGKNTAGQADFDLKTHDENGKPIPNLEHSVEMQLSVLDGSAIEKEISLKRTLKETWVKKRGSEEQVFKNNTTEYLVNGESYTAADYKKYISEIVNEEVFKAITSTTYFPSLKWQQQREFLTKMVSDITFGDITCGDEALQELADCLVDSKEDIIAYRKHLSYKIKQIKDRLDKIPVRLEEQNKALPEKLDWDNIQIEARRAKVEHDKLSDEIIKVKSGNGGDVIREQIRTELKDLKNKIEKIEDTERIAYNTRRQEHDNRIAAEQRKFNSLVTTQRDLEMQIQSFETLKKRCQETLDLCEKDAQLIRDEWKANESSRIEWDENESVCPTCGQYLPQEQLQEKKNQALIFFNKKKADKKQSLIQQAGKVKATRAEAENEMKGLDENKAQAEKNLAGIKEQINLVFSGKAKMEKEPVLSYEQALDHCADYISLLSLRKELQHKLDSVGIDEDAEKQLSDLEAKKAECSEILSRCNAQIATKTQYNKIQSLIAGIEQEQKDLISQLSELERKEDVARRYQDRQNAILENRINDHFSLVKWRMFRTVNNGGEPFDEPFCECYVDGVAYHDGLNQAARLNAGLDIINALCKHYNVSAPIVLDNSESTINILQTIGQQIRLQVADTNLQII